MTIDTGSTATSDFFSTLPAAHRDAARTFLNAQAPGCEFQKVAVLIDPTSAALYPHMETYSPIPGGSCAPSSLNRTFVLYPKGSTLVQTALNGKTNGVVVVDQGKIDSFGGGNANRPSVKNSKMGVFADGEIRVDRHLTYASAKFVKIDDMGNPVGASIDANGNISGTSYTVDQFESPPSGLDRNNVRPVINSESPEVFGLYSQNGNITVKNVFQANGSLDTAASAPKSLDFHGSVFSIGPNCQRPARTFLKCNESQSEFNSSPETPANYNPANFPLGCGFGVEQFNNKMLGNRGRLKLLGSNIMNRSGATGSPNCQDSVDGELMAGFQGQWNFDRRLGLGLVSVPGYPVSNIVKAQIRVIPIRNWRMADQAH